MKAILLGGVAALVLLAVPAAAQNDTSKTIDPVELSKQVKGPPAQISDEQRDAIQNALVAVHTQQKAPKDFNPQVGQDRKSTRLNSSHPSTSYAVYCLKKKKRLN